MNKEKMGCLAIVALLILLAGPAHAMMFIDIGHDIVFCDGTMGEKTWINNTRFTLSVIKAHPRVGIALGSTQDYSHIIYRKSDHLPVAMREGDASWYRGTDGDVNTLVEWAPGEVIIRPGDGVFTRYYCLAYQDNPIFKLPLAQTQTSFRAYLWLK